MPAPVPAIVLDTNTVLDWLVFRDAGMAPVAAALTARSLRWLACSSMRDELARTLDYRTLQRWQPDSEYVLSTFDRHTEMLAAAAAAPLTLHCSDTDDQVFLDLALAHRARWLLTHDRALLRLAKRCRAHGLCITQPRHWLPR